MIKILPSKWKMALRVIPFLIAIAAAKYLAYVYGWEFLQMNGILQL